MVTTFVPCQLQGPPISSKCNPRDNVTPQNEVKPKSTSTQTKTLREGINIPFASKYSFYWLWFKGLKEHILTFLWNIVISYSIPFTILSPFCVESAADSHVEACLVRLTGCAVPNTPRPRSLGKWQAHISENVYWVHFTEFSFAIPFACCRLTTWHLTQIMRWELEPSTLHKLQKVQQEFKIKKIQRKQHYKDIKRPRCSICHLSLLFLFLQYVSNSPWHWRGGELVVYTWRAAWHDISNNEEVGKSRLRAGLYTSDFFLSLVEVVEGRETPHSSLYTFTHFFIIGGMVSLSGWRHSTSRDTVSCP